MSREKEIKLLEQIVTHLWDYTAPNVVSDVLRKQLSMDIKLAKELLALLNQPECETCGDKKCSYVVWVTYQDNVGSGLYEEYHERQGWACSFFPPLFREDSMSTCIDSKKKYHHKIGWYSDDTCECESCKNKAPCPDCKQQRDALLTACEIVSNSIFQDNDGEWQLSRPAEFLQIIADEAIAQTKDGK